MSKDAKKRLEEISCRIAFLCEVLHKNLHIDLRTKYNKERKKLEREKNDIFRRLKLN